MNENQKNKPQASSTTLAKKGIQTDADFAAVFTALIADTLSGDVNPNVANAACNAAGKLLKMIDLRLKHGKGDGLRLTQEQTMEGAKEIALAKLSPRDREALGL